MGLSLPYCPSPPRQLLLLHASSPAGSAGCAAAFDGGSNSPSGALLLRLPGPACSAAFRMRTCRRSSLGELQVAAQQQDAGVIPDVEQLRLRNSSCSNTFRAQSARLVLVSLEQGECVGQLGPQAAGSGKQRSLHTTAGSGPHTAAGCMPAALGGPQVWRRGQPLRPHLVLSSARPAFCSRSSCCCTSASSIRLPCTEERQVPGFGDNGWRPCSALRDKVCAPPRLPPAGAHLLGAPLLQGLQLLALLHNLAYELRHFGLLPRRQAAQAAAAAARRRRLLRPAGGRHRQHRAAALLQGRSRCRSLGRAGRDGSRRGVRDAHRRHWQARLCACVPQRTVMK